MVRLSKSRLSYLTRTSKILKTITKTRPVTNLALNNTWKVKVAVPVEIYKLKTPVRPMIAQAASTTLVMNLMLRECRV